MMAEFRFTAYLRPSKAVGQPNNTERRPHEVSCRLGKTTLRTEFRLTWCPGARMPGAHGVPPGLPEYPEYPGTRIPGYPGTRVLGAPGIRAPGCPTYPALPVCPNARGPGYPRYLGARVLRRLGHMGTLVSRMPGCPGCQGARLGCW